MRRIGVMGGSFDPVHFGHVYLAEDALRLASLDSLILVPAKIQPFKRKAKPVPGEERMEMLKLAFEGRENISFSDFELKKRGVSYTINTLRAIKSELNEEDRVYFITGSDTFLKIEQWKGAEELLGSFDFIVGGRPRYADSELAKVAERVKEKYGSEVICIENRRIDISSTMLRGRLAKGEDVSRYMPEKVLEYIEKHGLYGNDAAADIWKKISEYNAAHLSEHRLKHTEGVRETAKKLAERYGEDIKKADFAALSHDMFKWAAGDELNALIESYGLSAKYRGKPNLAHSKLAAAYLKKEFGENGNSGFDAESAEDIINAVSFHTTGRRGMSRLEKIIFISDAIEPNRTYPMIEDLREIACDDLDRACLLTMRGVIEYLNREKFDIDGDTKDAVAWLESEEKMETYEIASLAAKVLLEKKGRNVSIIDMKERSSFADYFVLASAGSDRAVNSLVDELEERLAKNEILPKSIEGRGNSGWILMDYGDVLVSVFTGEMREKYNLEKLWGDCEIEDISDLEEDKQ